MRVHRSVRIAGALLALLPWAGAAVGEPPQRAFSTETHPTGAAVAAAAADLNQDGVQDLILRYSGADGPYLTLQYGNVDSVFPDTVQARQRRAEGRFEEAPFFPRVGLLRPNDVPAEVLTVLDDGSNVLRMRLNADALDDLVVLGDDGPPSILLSATAATITVDSATDGAVSGDARCTLREAMLNANADLDTTAGDCTAGAGADAIVFDIDGGGSRVTIAVGSAMPTVTDSVTINGNTQGCPLPPCVDLNGIPSLGANGLHLAGGASTIRGLAIRGFDEHGILVESPGNFIEGNFIGTNADGTVAVPNFMAGVFLSASDTTVGGPTTAARNLLSGNTDGISISSASGANTVEGNFIGTNAGGTAAIANDVWGIFVGNSPNNVFRDNVVSGNALGGIEFNGPLVTGNLLVGNLVGTDGSGTLPLPNDSAGIAFINDCSLNTIGGMAPEDRNVISGNDEFGLVLVNGATANTVLGNHIGTDVTGTVDLGNRFSGIIIQNASDNTIGGTAPGAGNLISGNDENGVFLLNAGGPADQNEILGNRIGTDIDGAASLGNTVDGVRIDGGTGNTIGGLASGARNLISGNGQNGVTLQSVGSDNNAILGNYIGVDADGVTPLGNGRSGVLLSSAPGNTIDGNIISANGLNGVRLEGASANTIGGTTAGSGNGIAANSQQGVAVRTGIRNAIVGNSIVANGSLGIDLDAPDGVTPNDAGDGDSGSNDLQNHPVLTGADATPSSVTLEGVLSSSADTTYRVEFFAGAACDASGHGEGERMLGFTQLTTDGRGDATIDETLSAAVSDGDVVTATATDPLGNTSEFSACVVASCVDLAVFGQPIMALDRETLVWAGAADIRFVRGDLADVEMYATTGDGTLLGATSLDISLDAPAPGAGLYYVVRRLGCGSWQTLPDAEPDRDAALP